MNSPAESRDRWQIAALRDKASHTEIAVVMREILLSECGAEPVLCEGRLWWPREDAIWRPASAEEVAAVVARTFPSRLRYLRRWPDVQGVARSLMAMAPHDEEFFAQAPRGVMCADGFWLVSSAGGLVSRPVIPDDRQRFRLEVAPDFQRAAEGKTAFAAYLAQSFAGTDAAQQSRLAAEVIGAALLGLAPALQCAVLLHGPARSGKSTLLRIIEALFPLELCAAVSPMRWASDYHVAALAGKRINLVPELPEGVPIPPSEFKAIIGCDRVSGRFPTQQPFAYRPEALHVFSANSYPATLERTASFFSRWRVLSFPNTVPEASRDPTLPERIVELELGAVLAWALAGGVRVARALRLGDSAENVASLEEWRIASNPVREFLTDSEVCTLGAGLRMLQSDLYIGYQAWARRCGLKPMSRRAFIDTARTIAPELGIELDLRSSSQRFAQGVALVSGAGPGLALVAGA